MDIVPFTHRLVPEHPQRRVIFSLLFASLVCVGMLGTRIISSHGYRFTGFFGNLLLAWIPLLLSLAIPYLMERSTRPRVYGWSATVVWILFFPNCFYMVTDLVHMNKFGTDGIPRWHDLLMTMCFAFTGMFLGSLSLYQMQHFVRKMKGRQYGWFFAIGMLVLGSYGIYLGRFLRLNSWDVVARPTRLARHIYYFAGPGGHSDVISFTITFFFFSLAAYAFFVSIAHLHAPHPHPLPQSTDATER